MTVTDLYYVSYYKYASYLQTLDSSQQILYVSDIRQAIKFAASDLKPSALLPGLCLPKVIFFLMQLLFGIS